MHETTARITALTSEITAFSVRIEELQRQAVHLTAETREGASSPSLLQQALSELQVSAEELQVAQEELQTQQEELALAQRRAEAEWERYHDLFEDAPESYVVTDMQGIIREANRAARHLLQGEHERMINKPLVNRVAPKARRAFRSLLNTLSSNEPDPEVEMQFQSPDGTSIDTALTIKVRRSREGTDLGIRWLIRDITQRKEAERLEAERIKVLMDNVRLHQAVYESSHRIKNHLQTLAAMVDIQLEGGKDFLPAEDFKRLGAQVRTLATIHELLTVDTKANGTAQEISVHVLLERVLRMLQIAAPMTPVRYEIAECTLSMKRAVSLALIVNELVANAMKHSLNSVIEVTFKVSEGMARLEVCDDGPGFAEDFTVHSAAHIGLELVEQIALTDLSGQVSYENRDEGGARVCVRFPVEPLQQI